MDWALLKTKLDRIGEEAIEWANPGLDVSARPTKDWLMTSFSDACLAVAGYLVFVLVGTALMQLRYGKKEPEEKAGRSVLQKFADEPIVILQALYNPAQVRNYSMGRCNQRVVKELAEEREERKIEGLQWVVEKWFTRSSYAEALGLDPSSNYSFDFPLSTLASSIFMPYILKTGRRSSRALRSSQRTNASRRNAGRNVKSLVL